MSGCVAHAYFGVEGRRKFTDGEEIGLTNKSMHLEGRENEG